RQTDPPDIRPPRFEQKNLQPAKHTLFPSTTLFRSRRVRRLPPPLRHRRPGPPDHHPLLRDAPRRRAHRRPRRPGRRRHLLARGRSEEHTSELQSRENLVCRLLLEKKKIAYRYD